MAILRAIHQADGCATMTNKKGLFTLLKRVFISEANSEKVKKISFLLVVMREFCMFLFHSFCLCINSYAEREEKKMDVLET